MLGVVYAVPAAVLAAVGLTLLGRRADPALAADVVVLALAALWLVWTVGPVLFFGLDETLDPARLRLLPLTPRQLAVGLTAASAVGIAPAATAIGLLGVVGGFAPLGPGALVVAAAVMVQFVLCIVSARALVTVLSPRLASRRGRDLVAVAGGVVGLSFAALGQVPNLVQQSDLDGAQLQALLGDVGRVVSLLPPGWAGRAVAAAADGQFLAGLGWLVAAAAVTAGVARGWVAALDRVSTLASAPASRGSGPDEDRDLFPRGLGALPRTPLGATVAKEVRYVGRVPQWRVALLLPVLGAVGLVVATAVLPALQRPEAVLAPPLLVAIVALSALNLFGADRGAVWLLVTSGADPRVHLLGKQLALGLVSVPLAGAATVAVAALAGGWRLLPAALVLGFVLFAAGMGVGGIASVLAPQPSPENPMNAFAAGAGTGCATAAVQLAAVTVLGVVLVPPAALALWAALARPGLLPVALAAGVVWAAGVWALGLRIAAARLAARGPEFVAALSVRAG